jgi:hypothetical protein
MVGVLEINQQKCSASQRYALKLIAPIMPYDLFISYSRRDSRGGRITQLVEHIKQEFAPFAKRDLVPFFDLQEIHGMEDWGSASFRVSANPACSAITH